MRFQNILHFGLARISPGNSEFSGLVLAFATILALNTLSVFAQASGGGGGSGVSFSSSDLKTGISNTLAVMMMFDLVLDIASVIYGGFAIRRGDVDQGKMSIIGGTIIAAAPARSFAFIIGAEQAPEVEPDGPGIIGIVVIEGVLEGFGGPNIQHPASHIQTRTPLHGGKAAGT
jgi:hypothetical protein